MLASDGRGLSVSAPGTYALVVKLLDSAGKPIGSPVTTNPLTVT